MWQDAPVMSNTSSAPSVTAEKHIEIAYILDRSGSMQRLQEAAVAAFNEFLKVQLTVPGEARLTLVQFDDQYEVPVNALRLQEVPQLTAATFVPRGGTALLDAIGRTLKELDIRLQKLPPAHQPAKVIVAIFTDGEENASRQYTLAHVSDLIAHHRDAKGWEFYFLAANQDAIATAASLSISASHSGSVAASAAGMMSTGGAIARKVRASRVLASAIPPSLDVLADAAKPMSEIVKEEEAKQ
jgi:uncharacterized protein YegL